MEIDSTRRLIVDLSSLFDKKVFPDRPWSGRGYGRLRLDEPLARDLHGIMYEEVRRRLNEYHEIKAAGGDVVAAKLALNRATKIRQRVKGVIVEQGWEDRAED